MRREPLQRFLPWVMQIRAPLMSEQLCPAQVFLLPPVSVGSLLQGMALSRSANVLGHISGKKENCKRNLWRQQPESDKCRVLS